MDCDCKPHDLDADEEDMKRVTKLENEFQQGDQKGMACCSETAPRPKRICRRASSQPHKADLDVKSYRYCTYCGLNLAAASSNSKVNMKCHLALKHTYQLCLESFGYGDDVVLEHEVDSKTFIEHLDVVSIAYNVLNSMNYKVVPACLYSEIMGIKMLAQDASQEEKNKFYKTFLEEAKRAFKMYQVIYLRGLTKPEKYEHLTAAPNSSYWNVNWCNNKSPSNTNFSLSLFNQSPEDKDAQALSIKWRIKNAVTMWDGGE